MPRIDRYVWGCCMDKYTCLACREMNGKEWKTKKHAAPTPHPKCTNPEGCRCQIIPVYDDEGVAILE